MNNTEKFSDVEKYNQDVENIMKLRKYQRERTKLNYHKRKAEGRLKTYYVKKSEAHNLIKPEPTPQEVEQYKNLKVHKQTKIKIDVEEYEALKLIKKEYEKLKTSN